MNKTNVMNKMTYFKTILTAFLFLAFLGIATAQTTSPSQLLASNDLTPKGINNDDWSFFFDEENKIYYIDFETINLNLTAVKVTNQAGKEVITDQVADLPVNTIYELYCGHLNSGNYTIELHSYTKILKKKVNLK